MSKYAKKVVLNSVSGYSPARDALLNDLIDSKVELLCCVGKDCETWHDVMDELIVGGGSFERDFFMVTTWHTGESLADTVEFAQLFNIDDPDNESVQLIEI